MADEVGGELERLYKQSCWQDDHQLMFANPTTGNLLDKSALRRRYRKALKAASSTRPPRSLSLREIPIVALTVAS